MEKQPIRNLFERTKQGLGRLVVRQLERRDDSLDIFSGTDLDDTQPLDTVALFAALGEEDHIVRGED